MTTSKTFAVGYEHPISGTKTAAAARDLSLGGMFVLTSAPLEVGALVSFEIDLEGIPVSVDARVLRREADGMEVVFIDLPGDVAATLSAAITPTSARTILGVGSTNIKATTPGIAAPASEPRVPVALPSVNTTTPGIAAPPEAKAKAKARADAKLDAKPEAKPEKETRDGSVPPPSKGGGSGGRWLLLLLLAGGAAAAYVYRDPLRREIEAALGTADGGGATPEPSPIAEAGAAESGAGEAGLAAITVDGSIADANVVTDAATDAATDGGKDAATDAASRDAASDAATHDAGDAGARDAGARDGGHREGGAPK